MIITRIFPLNVILLLAMTYLVLRGEAQAKLTTKHNLLEISKKLKLLNKPSVKSIQSEDGDIIDCVDIYKQPAFDHPALSNHTIQMKPSESSITPNTHKQKPQLISQLWRKSGTCPSGTIPIRRIKKRDLQRAESLQRFGRRNPTIVRRTTHQFSSRTNASVQSKEIKIVHFSEVNHSTAILLTQGFKYTGAKADINVWNPSVESDDEYTTGQIWVRNGPWNNFESIEAGWMVNPGLYGDRRTRLFAYWTADASKDTGCFDLTCSGFVQTSDKIAVGSPIDPVSWPGRYQYQITLYIYKDFDTNNWWLQYGNDVNIGYWPEELFRVLGYQATVVKWGGQVYSSKIGEVRPHTGTGMGSGETARIYGLGCYIRQIRIRDNAVELKYPAFVDTWMDEWNCYRAFLNWEYMIESEFYFGGPGKSYMCP